MSSAGVRVSPADGSEVVLSRPRATLRKAPPVLTPRRGPYDGPAPRSGYDGEAEWRRDDSYERGHGSRW